MTHEPEAGPQPLGLVVAVDGIEGAGKSTVARHIREAVPKHLRVVETRVFGPGTSEPEARFAVAEALYRLALPPENGLDEVERQLLFTVAARHHFRARLPALRAQNDLVLSHRSSLAPLAYGSAFDERVEKLVEWTVTPLASEDLALWLDIDPATAEARRTRKVVVPAWRAQASTHFQAEVNRRFRELARGRPWVKRLDATRPLSEIVAEAVELVTSLLAGHSLPP